MKILIALGLIIILLFIIISCTSSANYNEPELESELAVEVYSPGEVVINGAILVKGNWEPIILTDNPLAVNPSYSTLKAFLLKDKTDTHDYIFAFETDNRSYVCGDFAEALHNNAEAAGIRAGLVDFPDIEHVANAFETTDKGLIFIDCTGEHWLQPVTPPWMISFGEPTTLDKVIYIEEGKPMGFIELRVAEHYGFEYQSYELWKDKLAEFENVYERLQYEAEYIETNEKVKVTESGFIYPRVDHTNYLNLLEQAQDLDSQLGGIWEEEKDIITSYKIIWKGENENNQLLPNSESLSSPQQAEGYPAEGQ